jgi:hypothetical protein
VICANTKLIPTWRIGPRDAGVAYEIMQDVASRLAAQCRIFNSATHVLNSSGCGDTGDGHTPSLFCIAFSLSPLELAFIFAYQLAICS